jgi:hypothetical protein
MIAFLIGVSIGCALGYAVCGLMTRRRIEDQVDAHLQEAVEHFWEGWHDAAWKR